LDFSQETWQNMSMEGEKVLEENSQNDPKREAVNPSEGVELPEKEIADSPEEVKLPEKEAEQVPESLKKKSGFNPSFLVKLIIFATLALLLLLGIKFLISQSNILNNGIGESETEESTTSAIITKPEIESPEKTFTSDEFKFSVDYNTDLHELRTHSAFSFEPPQFLIIHKGESQEDDIKVEADLLDGYIVKISIYEDVDKEVLELAQRKREKYLLECSDVASIGSLYKRNIDGNWAQSFEVVNCPQDFIENFTVFKGNIVEITQIFRGDIGFKQSYKAQTEEILRSFKWLRDPEEEPDIATFRSEEYQLEFIHPVLELNAASVTPPSIENLVKVVVLVDPARKNEAGEVLDKVGIFAVPKGSKSFALFINEEKQSLIQEYKVVEGKNPTGLSEEVVLIGGVDGLKLVNYAWWGEVIYLDHPTADYFLIFVLPDGISDEFVEVLSEIFDTFVFEVEKI